MFFISCMISILWQTKKFLVELMNRLFYNTIHQPVWYGWGTSNRYFVHYWMIQLRYIILVKLLFEWRQFVRRLFLGEDCWLTLAIRIFFLGKKMPMQNRIFSICVICAIGNLRLKNVSLPLQNDFYLLFSFIV